MGDTVDIETISVEADYCFGSQPLRLEQLGNVSFIFAPNGAGKTTISNALAQQPSDPTNRTNWHVAPTDLPIRVFNEAYRARVLTEHVDGIFTMGDHSKAVNENVEELEAAKRSRRKDRDTWRKEIGSDADSQNLQGLKGEIQSQRNTTRQVIFDSYKGISQSAAQLVFEGFRNKRDKFLDETLRRFTDRETNPPDVTWDELEDRYGSLKTDTQTRTRLPVITTRSLISDEDIADVGQTITSSGTGELANVIQHLQNDNWVSDGRQYIHEAQGKCPFCQQATPADFEKKLQQYFAGGFDEALQRARKLKHSAFSNAEELEKELLALETAISRDPDIDASHYAPLFSRVRADTEILLARLRERSEHPTRPVDVVDINEPVVDLIRQVSDENRRVEKHNQLVANSGLERENLVDDGWALFLSVATVTNTIKRFQGVSATKRSRIADLQSRIASTEEEDKRDEQRITELRETISNTINVAERINKLLKAMGFHRFHLKVADATSGGYRIVRADGTPAFDSLSEGEKSFICFAYFWESLFGSEVSGGEPEDVVAVFDDPISSLDSDTLFIVAAHIRDAAEQIMQETTKLRQLIVLTHNTQFHHEAAYSSDRNGKGRRYYRLVKDLDGLTSVRDDGRHSKIRGSYSVLWHSIVEAARNDDESALIHVGIFNIVRRIIEGYFKIIGNITNYHRPDDLPLADQRMLSLFHIWANSGSHTIADDIDQTIDVESTKRFLQLLQKYFILEGHEAHFNMMIQASQGEDLLESGQLFAVE